MNIIDHGSWVRYQPASVENYPPGAMFVRRESDGMDWYDFLRQPTSPFASASTVKFAATMRPEGFIVGPAVYDPTLIFPPGHSVYEILDYAGSDPQGDFGNKIYDPVTDTFTPYVLPPAQDPLADIRRRLEALEKKKP